jgi:sugar (glycoside-pentoside-hexuronide) transporter
VTQAAASPARVRADERLPARVKAGYALGDHAINVQLAATTLFYLYFLTEVARLPPSLAGLVLLVGRGVDAFTDPIMGRISDRTRWRWGRRRPWFLIGAAPFGVTFAALWWPLPFQDSALVFLAYALLYSLNTLFSTILAVPYMALLPELALGYQERTSANTFRSIGVVTAVLLTAVGAQPLVQAFGGGQQGWATLGALMGIWVAVPWLVVHRVSWERPGFATASRMGLRDSMRVMAKHRAYRRLAGLFLSARIALDVVGAMLLFYFTYWLRRPEDFPLALGAMLVTVIVSLPLWLRLSRGLDKRALFGLGASWWILVQGALLLVEPSHPRLLVFALVTLAGIGYAVADMVPWSMLGDVIDADELATGERREGLYAGVFTFLRKLAGATGVALAGLVLQLSGFVPGQEQPESALVAIRILVTAVPALFLALAIAVARGYPITRTRHAEILERLDGRR